MAACKDCQTEGITTARPAPHPGPRCTTHHRARRRRQRDRAHELRTEQTYGISIETYWAIYAVQNGRCAICLRATGKTRRLAVDHDHRTGEVRGLCCATCNTIVLGRYDTAALQRAIDYLRDPPARKVLP